MADEYAGTGDEPFVTSGISDSGAIDPASIGTGGNGGSGNTAGTVGDDADEYQRNADGSVKRNADGSPRRKRVRRGLGGEAGSRPRREAKSKDDLKASVDALTNMLALVHVVAAGATQTPEIALDPEEAAELARAAVPVLDQFNFVPDPKYAAIFTFAMISVKIYGPRVYLIRARREQENVDRRAQTMRNVTPGFDPNFMGTV